MAKAKQMREVDLFGNGLKEFVCDSCFKGKHLDPCGYDHREGFKDKDEIGDCKETGLLKGKVVQCCCGVGKYVYNPEAGKGVKVGKGEEKAI